MSTNFTVRYHCALYSWGTVGQPHGDCTKGVLTPKQIHTPILHQGGTVGKKFEEFGLEPKWP